MGRLRLSKSQRIEAKVLLSLLFLLVILILCDLKMRPVIKTFSEYQAKILSTQLINEVVCDELEKDKLKYNDIVSTTTDDSGAITAIQTNSMVVNILKSRLTTAILSRLTEMDNTEIKINLGTLLGGQLFIGRGPLLSFKIVPTGEVSTELIHSFESAGINQTRHQILLNINITVTAMIAGNSNKVNVPCNFLIVDTIIIGKVPESFTNVNDDQSSIISKINDYANQK